MSETNQLSLAVAAVKSGLCSFCKFASANDAGSTGAHQSGIYIPKNSVPLIFDVPGIKGQNKERFAELQWDNGITTQCCFKYYGGGTRNEYRITRLGMTLRENDFIVIVKKSEDDYEGFHFDNEMLIDLFLKEFEITREETNALIPTIDSNIPFELFEKLNMSIQIGEPIQKSSNEQIITANFKPKAHILTLLGEELIKDPVMAIYELVKNSYDADAKNVDVYFTDILDLDKASIVIIDSGVGMTDDILENVWLEPGTAHRKPIGEDGKRNIFRSPIFERVPMGEKGVGRFAVHKLGNKIELISRPCKVIIDDSGRFIRKEICDYEINLEIDWKSFTQAKYLSDVSISYVKNIDPESFYFKDDSGTYIKVSDLKEPWNRRMARRLKRHTLSMVSPKNDPSKFAIDLNFNNNWLDRLPDVDELLKQAPYKLTAIIDKNYNLTFEYEFKLANNPTIGIHAIKDDVTYDKSVISDLRPLFRSYYENKDIEDEEIEKLLQSMVSVPMPYGGIMIELYSYDLDMKSLRDITYAPDILKKTLRDLHGIKVFKGDLRVYDYGEPGNDWLGLDLKRVNNKEWFSNNQNIGFVYLEPEDSTALIEKTNREGFISNDAFDHFHLILEYILNQFKIERQRDRLKWMRLNKNDSNIPLTDRLTEFVALINDAEIEDVDKKQKLLEQASRIGSDYEKAQETLLIPAGVGMTASVALHEIEKLVPRMAETVEIDPVDAERIRNQVEELDEYVSGILTVLKQAGTQPVEIEDAVKQALRNYRLKLTRRKIGVTIEIQDNLEFVRCDKRYLVTILMNLIDNSIYWLDTVNRDSKSILIKAFTKDNIPRIVVADNGPGFKDTIEEIITPFFSRKDSGIGIGMYLVDTIMMKYGKLHIYDDNDKAGIDKTMTGAIVELVFNKNQED